MAHLGPAGQAALPLIPRGYGWWCVGGCVLRPRYQYHLVDVGAGNGNGDDGSDSDSDSRLDARSCCSDVGDVIGWPPGDEWMWLRSCRVWLQ